MIEIIRSRRSVREFLPNPVETEKIELLQEAALRAPTSRNRLSCYYYFITNRAILESLAIAKPQGGIFLKEAPLAVVVTGDEKATDVWVEDCSIGCSFLQLMAASLGLGSCWVQIRNRWHNDHITAEGYIQDLLQLPGNLRVEALIAIGYPAIKPAPVPARDLALDHINFIH
ncbi:MAG: nitroreductase family protein [Candidatus Cloacimonetes bacterium]|nr:nitroreductase family protein [Candidatus Cloacimonadota bacterium]